MSWSHPCLAIDVRGVGPSDTRSSTDTVAHQFTSQPATTTAETATIPLSFHGNNEDTFTIRSYTTADHKAVCDLFAEGMRFYRPPETEDSWLHYGFDRYIQECMDTDLKDIEADYMATGGHFWVVTSQKETTIAAIVAVQNKGDGKGELRRLSVHEDYRRHGLGARLVGHVEDWARAHKFSTLTLNTDCAMTGALKLYDRLGYQRTHTETIREEPYYYLIHFEKSL